MARIHIPPRALTKVSPPACTAVNGSPRRMVAEPTPKPTPRTPPCPPNARHRAAKPATSLRAAVARHLANRRVRRHRVATSIANGQSRRTRRRATSSCRCARKKATTLQRGIEVALRKKAPGAPFSCVAARNAWSGRLVRRRRVRLAFVHLAGVLRLRAIFGIADVPVAVGVHRGETHHGLAGFLLAQSPVLVPVEFGERG